MKHCQISWQLLWSPKSQLWGIPWESVFKRLAQRVVTRDRSTVGQAAPNTKALHNPVSLMQDLKSITDAGISRPWELWVLLRLGSVLDVKSLQSPALSLACPQWIKISKLLKFSCHDGRDVMSSYIWKQCNSCQLCWMPTGTAKLTQKLLLILLISFEEFWKQISFQCFLNRRRYILFQERSAFSIP